MVYTSFTIKLLNNQYEFFHECSLHFSLFLNRKTKNLEEEEKKKIEKSTLQIRLFRIFEDASVSLFKTFMKSIFFLLFWNGWLEEKKIDEKSGALVWGRMFIVLNWTDPNFFFCKPKRKKRFRTLVSRANGGQDL